MFGYKQHESVKLLLCCLQRLDFKRFYDLKRLLFLKRVQSSSNSVIKSVLPFELCEYKVCLNWNVAKLRHSVNNVYVNLLVFHNVFSLCLSIYLSLYLRFIVVSLYCCICLPDFLANKRHRPLYNQLPSQLRSSSVNSRGQFRAGLKTHLFTQAYGHL